MPSRWRHPPGDAAVVAVAAITCVGVWSHTWTAAAVLATAAGAVFGRRLPAVAGVGACLGATANWGGPYPLPIKIPRSPRPVLRLGAVVGEPETDGGRPRR